MARCRAALLAVIIALTASGFGLADAATAVASPWNGGQLQINVGRGWTSHASTPLFTVGTIEPGWRDTARLGIRNASVQSGALTIAATHVSEQAGCAGGPGCTGDKRRLGQDLRLTVFLESGSSHADRIPLCTGLLDDLRSPVSLARNMPAGATWHLRIDASLPSATGNDDQGAQLNFDVTLRLQGQAAEVLAIHTARGESAGDHGLLSSLPFTGEPLVPLLAGAGLLLVAGVALVRVGRSRWAR